MAELYTVYGLTVRSTLVLPELASGSTSATADGPADVDIRVACVPEPAARARADTQRVSVSARETCFVWDDVGAFVVRDGREILADPLPGVDERLVRMGVLGPALAVLLQQAGRLVLHASAVSIGGRVVGFLGVSGAGKSTIAAALHARGHPHVVDDALALHLDDDGVRVLPGIPHVKLWPDAVIALGHDPHVLPRVDPALEKRARPVWHGADALASLPLDRLYVLARGRTVAVRSLSRTESFLQLVSHSFGIEWLHDVSGSAYFAGRAALARRVPVRRLERPWRLDSLVRVVAAVEHDVDRDP